MRHLIAALACATTMAGCAAQTQPENTPNPSTADGGEVVVVTHDSFAIPDDLVADFEAEHNLDLTFFAPGDAGLLVNQLILTKGEPLGDIAYGVDNTFASRALNEGVFAPYASTVPAASDARAFAAGTDGRLTPIDFSDVCVNADLGYFADAGLALPATLDDLAKPEYAGLLSVPSATTSSPGLAFLLGTVAAKPQGWEAYWESLKAGGLRTTASWSDTYFTDFSAPNYGGEFPLVVSYASSPPSEVVDGSPTTVALLDTCFRQVEYAGILDGANNAAGAALVIDWMLSDEFQSALPESMYVYPVSSSATIPDAWAQYAPLADKPWSMDPSTIDEHRDEWIATWSGIVLD